MAHVKAVPTGYTTVTASITVKEASKAIEFYKKAFGATERGRHQTPDGKIMHAELQVGSSILMLSDEVMGSQSPSTLGGSPVAFYMYVDDAAAAFEKAVAAGGKQTMAVTDMFWGDRLGQFEDPYGFRWNVASHIKDMTPEEIKKAGEEFLSRQMAGAK